MVWWWWWRSWLWLVFAILRACRAPQDHALSDVGRATANTQSFRLHSIWIDSHCSGMVGRGHRAP